VDVLLVVSLLPNADRKKTERKRKKEKREREREREKIAFQNFIVIWQSILCGGGYETDAFFD